MNFIDSSTANLLTTFRSLPFGLESKSETTENQQRTSWSPSDVPSAQGIRKATATSPVLSCDWISGTVLAVLLSVGKFLSANHCDLHNRDRFGIYSSSIAMSWSHAYNPTPGVHCPIREYPPGYFIHVGPLETRRIPPRNHEIEPRQWTCDPNLNSHATSTPIMNAVSNLPPRNHSPSMGQSDVSMDPRLPFYQMSQYSAHLCPTAGMARSSFRIRTCPYAADNGRQIVHLGFPSDCQGIAEELQAGAHRTEVVGHTYESAPTVRFGYEGVPHNPWTEVILEGPRDPETLRYASRKCPHPRYWA